MNVLRALLLALALVSPLPAVALTRAPYVQLVGPDSVLIAWRTDEPRDSVVEYGLDETYGQTASVAGPTAAHAVVISGLQAATAYRYRLRAGGELLAAGKTFRTAPLPGSTAPFRFAALADTGGGTQAQIDVAVQLALGSPDLVLHAGDLVYTGPPATDLDARYFEVYQELIASVPFYIAVGNKEVEFDAGAAFLEAFHLPRNGTDPERYYSFTYGNAAFIALDTNLSLAAGSQQIAWLEAELPRIESTWKVVFFHHPMYTAGRGDTSHRQQLEPLFREHGVDLVLQAHTHFYERTFPVHLGAVVGADSEPDYVDPAGTVYVITGGGGGVLATGTPNERTAKYDSLYHHVIVDVAGDLLTLTAIDWTGAEIDRMTLRKTAPPPVLFHRGDVDGIGGLDIADAVRVLLYLFLGTEVPDCLEAADADDDGQLQITDAMQILGFLFTGGASPAPPGPPPAPCGPDPAGSPAIGCAAFAGC